MKPFTFAAASLIVTVAVSGCAGSTMTSATPPSGIYAKPEYIVVYDFAATPAEIAADRSLGVANAGRGPQPTAEEAAIGRELGTLVARELVAEIRAMGLPAARAQEQPAGVGDLVLKGYFESMDAGSAAKRIGLGFGSGAAQLKTVVKGYEMTKQGLRERGTAEFDSAGGKTPGVAVPLVVTVVTGNPVGLVVGGAVKATREIKGSDKLEGAAKRTAKAIGEELRARFERQGWIEPE